MDHLSYSPRTLLPTSFFPSLGEKGHLFILTHTAENKGGKDTYDEETLPGGGLGHGDSYDTLQRAQLGRKGSELWCSGFKSSSPNTRQCCPFIHLASENLSSPGFVPNVTLGESKNENHAISVIKVPCGTQPTFPQ
jgi:hypothetical protein